jgi:hypothetical protein
MKDDNDLSSRQISTIVYPGDGKSVEDKLKQRAGTMIEGNMHREGYEGMFERTSINTLLKYPPNIRV